MKLEIDHGCYEIKFSIDQDEPQHILSKIGVGESEKVYGEQARNMKSINFKISDVFDLSGRPTSNDNLFSVYDHIVKDICKKNKEDIHEIIFATKMNSSLHYQGIMEDLFLNYTNLERIKLIPEAVINTHALGLTQGIFVDSGYNGQRCVPVCEGSILSHCVTEGSYGNIDVNKSLLEFFKFNTGINNLTLYHIDDMRKNNVFSLKTDKETVKHTLPDGLEVDVHPSIHQIFHDLFIPQEEALGLCGIVESSIKLLDMDLRKQMSQQILCLGGGTFLEGFNDTFEQKLSTVLPPRAPGKIINSFNKTFPVDNGSVKGTELFTINKDEFNEVGPSIVNRKLVY